MLFAQDVTGIVGLGGWAGAGLLGAVLAWLLFVHLPSKDKQLGDFITAKDLHTREMVTACEKEIQALSLEFAQAIKEQRQDFRDTLNQILIQSEKQTNFVSMVLKEEVVRLVNAVAEHTRLVYKLQSEFPKPPRKNHHEPPTLKETDPM